MKFEIGDTICHKWHNYYRGYIYNRKEFSVNNKIVLIYSDNRTSVFWAKESKYIPSRIVLIEKRLKLIKSIKYGI